MKTLLFLLALLTLARVEAADAPPAPVGIIILQAVPEHDAAAILFVSIQWVDRYNGYVVDQAGTKTPFVTEAIGRIIYFDQTYYEELDGNQNWVEWRYGIRSREYVILPIHSISLRPANVSRLASDQAILEDTMGRYAVSTELLTPMIATLKDESAKLSSGLVLQDGAWVAEKDAVTTITNNVPVVGDAEILVTFTTKDGKRFENAKIMVNDSGISVLTDDGGAAVSFDRLPDDLSAFPATMKGTIVDAKNKYAREQRAAAATAAAAAAAAAPPPPPPSFMDTISSYFHQVVAWFRSMVGTASTPAPAGGSTTNAPPTPGAPATSSATPTNDSMKGVVLIKGDAGAGTGFLVRTPSGPVVLTNLHVIAGNPNIRILLTTGEQIVPLSMQGASDRDLAMFSIQDNHYSYLELEDKIDQNAAAGDEAIIPGNSEGGGVILKTDGKLVAIGPERIEFSNPIYHGNSGGPVLDVKTGKVVAVVAAATKFNPQDDLDRQSFASSDSAIAGPYRYYGLRVDTVPAWQSYDQDGFVRQTLFLKDFHAENRALDGIVNGSRNQTASPSHLEGPPDPNTYTAVPSVRNAIQMWLNNNPGRSPQAAPELIWQLDTVASADLDEVKNTGNFYPYLQSAAKYDLDYRTTLLNEIRSAAH